MNDIKVIIDACVSILDTKMNLCGYAITLQQVFLYGIVGFILLYFIFGIMK